MQWFQTSRCVSTTLVTHFFTNRCIDFPAIFPCVFCVQRFQNKWSLGPAARVREIRLPGLFPAPFHPPLGGRWIYNKILLQIYSDLPTWPDRPELHATFLCPFVSLRISWNREGPAAMCRYSMRAFSKAGNSFAVFNTPMMSVTIWVFDGSHHSTSSHFNGKAYFTVLNTALLTLSPFFPACFSCIFVDIPTTKNSTIVDKNRDSNFRKIAMLHRHREGTRHWLKPSEKRCRFRGGSRWARCRCQTFNSRLFWVSLNFNFRKVSEFSEKTRWCWIFQKIPRPLEKQMLINLNNANGSQICWPF